MLFTRSESIPVPTKRNTLPDQKIPSRHYSGLKGSSISQLSSPSHLALDDRGRVFIADCVNCGIVLLNDRLKLQRILLKADNLWREDEGLPKEKAVKPNLSWRLHYLPQSGKLLVALNNGAVHMYDLLGRDSKKHKRSSL
jgi:hypothetical protein